MIQIDDLWLASYLITQGAELAGVQVLPYNNGGRLRAVFELVGEYQSAIESYANGNPRTEVHALREAMNRLRDLMYAELEKRNGNGSIKHMPNNGGQRRRGEHESRAIRHR